MLALVTLGVSMSEPAIPDQSTSMTLTVLRIDPDMIQITFHHLFACRFFSTPQYLFKPCYHLYGLRFAVHRVADVYHQPHIALSYHQSTSQVRT